MPGFRSSQTTLMSDESTRPARHGDVMVRSMPLLTHLRAQSIWPRLRRPVIFGFLTEIYPGVIASLGLGALLRRRRVKCGVDLISSWLWAIHTVWAWQQHFLCTDIIGPNHLAGEASLIFAFHWTCAGPESGSAPRPRRPTHQGFKSRCNRPEPPTCSKR